MHEKSEACCYWLDLCWYRLEMDLKILLGKWIFWQRLVSLDWRASFQFKVFLQNSQVSYKYLLKV